MYCALCRSSARSRPFSWVRLAVTSQLPYFACDIYSICQPIGPSERELCISPRLRRVCSILIYIHTYIHTCMLKDHRCHLLQRKVLLCEEVEGLLPSWRCGVEESGGASWEDSVLAGRPMYECMYVCMHVLDPYDGIYLYTCLYKWTLHLLEFDCMPYSTRKVVTIHTVLYMQCSL